MQALVDVHGGCRIIIEDNGIGIAPENIPIAFAPVSAGAKIPQ